MELLLQILLFVGSIAALLWSSDRFVGAAERLGLSWGISPFVVGVTIVAFGTSLPELSTSVVSVLNGSSQIVVGNVVGSNIANIALVLGLTAALTAAGIGLEEDLWRIDIPVLVGSAFLLYFVVADAEVSLYEAILFLLGIVVFLGYSLGSGDKADKEDRPEARPRDYLFLVLGAAVVSASATFVIEAITNISAILAIAPSVIALTAVAIGTSLPEVAVSLAAARRGKAGIAVGNVVGSNIFNTFVVMSIPRLLGPLVIPADVLDVYLPLMVVMTLLLAFMVQSRSVSRWEGMLLLLFYAWYLGAVIRQAT